MSGIIQSSDVLSGDEIRADQINRLYEDLIRQHDHSTNKIDHALMAETGRLQGLDTDHERIDTHIVGDGASFTDSPGGAQGVHGLTSIQYVAGSGKWQMIAQWDIIPNTDPNWRDADAEWPEDSDNWVKRNRFQFPVAYDEPPEICLICVEGTASVTTSVYQRLKTSFAFKIRYPGARTTEAARSGGDEGSGIWPTAMVLAIGRMAV